MIRNPLNFMQLRWPNRLRPWIFLGILVLALGWNAGQLSAAIGPAERSASVHGALAGREVALAVADLDSEARNGDSFTSRPFWWPTRLWLRIPLWILVLVLIMALGRFVYNLLLPWRPLPIKDSHFFEHALTHVSSKITVTAAALGPIESYQVFGVPLALRGVQPVWLEITNNEAVPVWYLRAGTDNAWYSPYEAFYVNRFRAPRRANRMMEELFYRLHFQNPIMPGKTNAGFVYTRLDEDTKAADIDVVGLGTVRSFSFQLRVPGFRSAYREGIITTITKSAPIQRVESEEEFRKALEDLPSHTTSQKGDRKGDPLNLVVVGGPQDVFPAMSRRGWHGTEQTHRASVIRTIRSAILRRAYLYSPVSPLYAFGRSQDLSGQKARGDINLRNHLRLWLTPIQFRGQLVWIGQISRDIGVRFLWAFPPTTHKIDPDTDEARNGLAQDLAYSQALGKFGFVKGAGAAPRSDPKRNLTGDPYFTDGLRIVMFFQGRPTTLGDIEMLDWERPAGTPQSGPLFGRGTTARPATKT
jgi:LssY C-terminus